jgi:resuscitation-promoting factor RpfA
VLSVAIRRYQTTSNDIIVRVLSSWRQRDQTHRPSVGEQIPGPRPRPGRLPLLAGRGLSVLARDSWRAVLRPGPASLDQAVTAICASLSAALVAWLLLALLASLTAALLTNASRLGTAATRGARLLAPAVLRNAVAALLGVAIFATPAAADTGSAPPAAATSASAPAARPVTDQEPVADLSPNWPVRTTSPVWTSTVPATSSRTSTAPGTPPGISTARAGRPHPELSPGWVPSRPAPDRASSSRAATRDSSGSRSATPRPKPRTWPSPTGTVHRSDRTMVDDTIVVRRGDTLWSLASRHLGPGASDAEIATEWPRWFTMNRHVIGADPDHLLPGERLRPPGPHLLTRPARAGEGTIR